MIFGHLVGVTTYQEAIPRAPGDEPFREIAILENLRLTGHTLYPYSNFATRKASDKNTLDLHIGTQIH